jgi:hypothetical protein
MEAVKAAFKLYHQEDEDTGCNAYSQTNNVDERIVDVAGQRPECRL